MSRRHHKKSKNGCLQCKRRHMRCDEHRPICANCDAAEIQCSFLNRESLYVTPAFSHSNPGVSPARTVSPATSTTALTQRHECAMIIQEPLDLDLCNVNMIHMELFNNLSSKEFLSVEVRGRPEHIPLHIFIKNALTAPYLMHEILALSAFQLSTKLTSTEEARRLYREYATALQNRALSLFNESNPVLEMTPANCVQIFLFSSVVGIHLLSDALRYQRESLEGFIDQFVNGLRIYHGVRAVVEQGSHLLRDTELGPRLNLSQDVNQPLGSRLNLPEDVGQPTASSGSECDALFSMLNAANISSSSREAYQESIAQLQVIFDTARETSGSESRMPMVFGWPILISPEYIDLVRQRQPEALVILAHFAALLHRGADFWLIGDSGQFLVESICGSLDSNWQKWLLFPKAVLQRDSVA